MKRNIKVAISYIFGFLALTVLILGAVFLIPRTVFLKPIAFSTQDWKSSEYPDDDKLKMALGLIKSDELVGKTEEQIVQLLGKPDDKMKLGYDYIYILGSDIYPLSVDDSYLGVRFSNQIVTTAAITGD